MTTKELVLGLTGRNQAPKGAMRKKMFEFHNSMIGKSKYFKRIENPDTRCGSCIQRVVKAIFDWYHYDESAPSYSEIEFTGRLGLNNKPIYKFVK